LAEGAQRRILILTADAGFGHRSAANAIGNALERQYGSACNVKISNPMDDHRVPSLLRDAQLDYDRVVRETPRLYQVGYDLSNAPIPIAVVDGALILMLFEVLRDLLRRYRPHVIITTYPLYQAPLGAVFTLTRWNSPLITVVTDLAAVHRMWFSDVADLCLVPTRAVWDMATKSALAPTKVWVTGIPVVPALAEETRPKHVIRRALGWRVDAPTVLVVGSKRVGHLLGAVRALNHARLGLQMIVIAGGDDALFAQFQQTEWHTYAHVYNFVTNMPTMLCAADFIICKAGGLIVSESLACGLPILLVDVVPGQEAGNADYVVRNGAGSMASDPMAVLETAFHWLDRDGAELVRRQELARALGRPRAAFVVAELAWSYAEKGHRERPSRDPGQRAFLKRWLDDHNIPWRERPAKL